jgi:2-isopropylmalate synthase
MAARKRRIEIYDTTLRDGTQGIGVSLSAEDKLQIADRLDRLGVDFIEGGYPLSNPKDVEFFQRIRKKPLKNACVVAFGMTRRKERPCTDDPGMEALVRCGAETIAIVGKSWDLHVRDVLRVSRDENLRMIGETIAYLRGKRRRIIYDAEHFFDGYKHNPSYALQTVTAALESGAETVCLCDTNGGSLPDDIGRIVDEVRASLPDVALGIHTHNDSGLAVANSLRAVEHGCTQVQGTINGIGERCGNVDLLSVIANLRLKMGYNTLKPGALRKLTELSRYVYELANMSLVDNQPYVGPGAFAHKGGMHVHAVMRNTDSYEHVSPADVGNTRQILISELSGASNVSDKIKRLEPVADPKMLRSILLQVQDMENEGYQFEAAEASFELLMRKALGTHRTFFELDHYRTVVFRVAGKEPVTEATVKISVDGVGEHCVAEGDGPVNALDCALRKALSRYYPAINDIHLIDYKVRVINSRAESAAKVRVVVEFRDGEHHWGSVGVSENIIDASWQCLVDSIEYKLLRDQDKRATAKRKPRSRTNGRAVRSPRRSRKSTSK